MRKLYGTASIALLLLFFVQCKNSKDSNLLNEELTWESYSYTSQIPKEVETPNIEVSMNLVLPLYLHPENKNKSDITPLYELLLGTLLLDDSIDAQYIPNNRAKQEELSMYVNKIAKKIESDFLADQSSGADVDDDLLEDWISKSAVLYNSTYEVIDTLTLNAHGIVSVYRNAYLYNGGAHGLNLLSGINYDLKEKHIISLEDLFIDSYTDELPSLIKEQFLEDYSVSTLEELQQETMYFTMPNDSVVLPSEFVLYDGAIGFIYNEYEIAPYAAGTAQVSLPYDRVRHLLKERYKEL